MWSPISPTTCIPTRPFICWIAMSFCTVCALNVFCTEPFAFAVSRLRPAVLSCPLPASPRTVSNARANTLGGI